jgi:hypothetical protein
VSARLGKASRRQYGVVESTGAEGHACGAYEQRTRSAPARGLDSPYGERHTKLAMVLFARDTTRSLRSCPRRRPTALSPLLSRPRRFAQWLLRVARSAALGSRYGRRGALGRHRECPSRQPRHQRQPSRVRCLARHRASADWKARRSLDVGAAARGSPPSPLPTHGPNQGRPARGWPRPREAVRSRCVECRMGD